MRFSELIGRKVVSTSSAGTVGKVKAVLVDPHTRTVAGLALRKTESGSTLAWSDLTAVGADAVTVADASAITDPQGPLVSFAHKDRKALGKRVLSTGGDRLGTLKDLDFDPETGRITALLLDKEELRGSRLIGIGSWAVVVSAVE